MSAAFYGRNGFARSWWFAKSEDWRRYVVICLQGREFAPAAQCAVVDDFGDLVRVPS